MILIWFMAIGFNPHYFPSSLDTPMARQCHESILPRQTGLHLRIMKEVLIACLRLQRCFIAFCYPLPVAQWFQLEELDTGDPVLV